ncbi:hypothetical protein MP228_003262 [Amoeboaphelidium protococcarum]|nr:hypothetical protein MP228_003262 [Amoeboaphelidium protococcarum]
MMTELIVGDLVEITDSQKASHKGHIYAVDKQIGIVALQQPPSTPLLPHQESRNNYVLLNMNSVRNVQVLENKSKSFQNGYSDTRLSNVNNDKVTQRERNAIRNKEMALSRVNKAVSPEVQAVFDALTRTLPCQWQTDRQNSNNGQAVQLMVVFGGLVVISPPYKADDQCVRGGDRNAVDRVKKVLRFERQRLKLPE